MSCVGVVSEGVPLAPGSAVIASGVSSVLPGGSIGVQEDVVDEGAYVIVSGSGDYIDSEGKRHPVEAGEITCC